MVKVPEEENKSGWKLEGQTLQISVLPRETITQLKDKILKEVSCGISETAASVSDDVIGWNSRQQTEAAVWICTSC